MMTNLVLETYGLGNVSLGSAYKMGINFSCTAIKVKEHLVVVEFAKGVKGGVGWHDRG